MDRQDKFRTILEAKASKRAISYRDRLLGVGSCFVENMGNRLIERAFRILVNPFGILYNPISISNALDRLIENKAVEKEELIEDQWGLFHHWDFHGDFSADEAENALAKMNQSLEAGSAYIRDSEVLVVTFGSAGVWELAENGKIVGNCHKFPGKIFTHRQLGIDEMTEAWINILSKLKNETKFEQVILTVSPVRYLQQGFEANSLSKAKLRLLCQDLTEKFNFVSYFPAFEILQDDLRDYRFYAKDLVHPSEMAVDYVWDVFQEALLDQSTRELSMQIEALQHAASHRPFNPRSEAHKEFCRNQIKKAEEIMRENEELELGEIVSKFKSYL